MPCNTYDPNPCGHLRTELDILKAPLKDTEAVACALINQLQRMELDDIIVDAEKNGKVEIQNWWKQHCENDMSRLSKKLEMFSQDEIDLLRKMLLDEKE